MMDYPTIIEIGFNIIIWGIIVYILKSAINYPFALSDKNFRYGILLMFVFCIFPFWSGDYFHYKEIFEIVKSNGTVHLEDIYVDIIQNYTHSYHLFRSIVWGPALIMLVYAYKRVEVHYGLVLFYFAAFYLIWFSYARVSLSMSMIFLGVTYISKPIVKHKSLSFILGIMLLFCSLIFHRTALIGVVIAICSFVLRNPNRRTLLFIAIAFPFAVMILSNILSQFAEFELSDIGYMSNNHRDYYLNGDSHGGLDMGFGPFLMVLLVRFPLFIVFLLYILCIRDGLFCLFPFHIRVISSYAFLTILISLLFLFDLGYNTYTIYYRILNYSMIPSAVFIANVRKLFCYKKYIDIFFVISILGTFYTLLYYAYCSVVN